MRLVHAQHDASISRVSVKMFVIAAHKVGHNNGRRNINKPQCTGQADGIRIRNRCAIQSFIADNNSMMLFQQKIVRKIFELIRMRIEGEKRKENDGQSEQ